MLDEDLDKTIGGRLVQASHMGADRDAGRHQIQDPRLLQLDRWHCLCRQPVGTDIDRAKVDERPVEVEEYGLTTQAMSLRWA